MNKTFMFTFYFQFVKHIKAIWISFSFMEDHEVSWNLTVFVDTTTLLQVKKVMLYILRCNLSVSSEENLKKRKTHLKTTRGLQVSSFFVWVYYYLGSLQREDVDKWQLSKHQAYLSLLVIVVYVSKNLKLNEPYDY